MATSTVALPVKTAFLPESQHGRHSRRKTSLSKSPTASFREKASGQSPKSPIKSAVRSPVSKDDSLSARRTSTANNALGITGAKSWASKGKGSVAMAMKDKRERGGSESGRRVTSLQTNGFTFPMSPPWTSRTPLSAKPTSSTDELINGILLPLPFLLASLAFPTPHSPFVGPLRASSPADTIEDTLDALVEVRRHQHFVQAGALSASALILVGTIARLRLADSTLDRRKDGIPGSPRRHSTNKPPSSLKRIGSVCARMLSMGLPFYSSVQLGGFRVALVLLLTTATGLANVGINAKAGIFARVVARKSAVGLLVLLALSDLIGLFEQKNALDPLLGYLALFTASLVIPPPFPYLDRLLGRHMPIIAAVSAPATPVVQTPPTTPRLGAHRSTSSTSKLADANTSIVAGSLLAMATSMSAYSYNISLDLTPAHLLFSLAALAATAVLTFFSLPINIGAKGKPGLAIGLLLTAMTGAFVQTSDSASYMIPTIYTCLCVAAYLISLRSAAPDFGHFRESRSNKQKKDYSMFTGYLLSYCAPGSMLDTILSQRDSRRIAYFGCLNLGFMLVQFFYGFATGSLGLLTDSIHMLFDCLGLAVGLVAAVMSKWPPSLAFPYGYGRVDNLSGFANGIFLILVSLEIIMDAIHRLHDGHELQRLNELLIVSVLGFLVNIVGLTAFGHAHHHHGHDHAHGHAHSHDHSHTHENAHDHEQHHAHDHSHHGKHDENHHPNCNGHTKTNGAPSPLPDLPPTPFSLPSLPSPLPTPSPSTEKEHSHGLEKNENMHGIFLHVLADALGSVAVIFSTILTKYDGWSGWDPLASCAIAILIFFSAIPLVKSTGRKLLLALPNEVEYSCRDTLQGLGELRGIAGYSGVRVWQDDGDAHGSVGHHHHHHSHSHDSHDHHEHDHTHGDPHGNGGQKLRGVIHIIAAQTADMNDVGERAGQYLKGRGLDLIQHVEREGTACWCANDRRPSQQ